MSDFLRSVWGNSVHFAKFQIIRFSKGYCSHSFYPISTKLDGQYGNRGEGIQASTSFGDLPNCEYFTVVEYFLLT